MRAAVMHGVCMCISTCLCEVPQPLAPVPHNTMGVDTCTVITICSHLCGEFIAHVFVTVW